MADVTAPAVGEGTNGFAIAATKMDGGFAQAGALQDAAIKLSRADPEGAVIESAYEDDDDEYKSDGSEGYSSDGSVYIDEDAKSSDGSDEDNKGNITDDDSDFEQEEGRLQDGNDINEADHATEDSLTESSESEAEVESPAPVNKTGGRNLKKAPSSANKTAVSRVASGRVTKSGTPASAAPLTCPVKNCGQTFTSKDARSCLWHHLKWFATSGVSERADFEHAHSVAHEEMKRAVGKCYSHTSS
jgi:hypothetical protein